MGEKVRNVNFGADIFPIRMERKIYCNMKNETKMSERLFKLI